MPNMKHRVSLPNCLAYMKYSISKSSACVIDITIISLDCLKRIDVWRDQPLRINKGLVSRISGDIPSRGGIYFLFGNKGILLYIGKASNIRQRINNHTKQRTIEEIANQEKRNPSHIKTISWIEADDEGCRDILETAYLRSYGTAWNADKIDPLLEYPAAPYDEELKSSEVIKYLEKQKVLLNNTMSAAANKIFGQVAQQGVPFIDM